MVANSIKYSFASLAAAALLLGFATVASALHSPEHYSLFGDASFVSPGNASSSRAVHLVSDAAPGYGGVDYGIESGVTFADLQQLSTDYKFESDDSCMGGSPRFQVAVTDPVTGDEGNIFVYLGPAPNYTGCLPGTWQSSGDLLEATTTVDTSQLAGGTFYDPYATALVKYGGYTVTGVSLVADASWAAGDGEQAVDVDNTMVDGTLFTYEIPVPTSADQCKKSGWMTMADDQGSMFKNQGQCVSFVNKNK
jgi:hypothetical protein